MNTAGPYTWCITGASLQALMCRKHKGEEVAALRLHPWSARETRLQAGIRGGDTARQERAA